MDCHFRDLPLMCHWWVASPKIGTVNSLGLCSDQVILFTLLGGASFPHYNNTKIIKIIWFKTFYIMSNFLWTVIFGICH